MTWDDAKGPLLLIAGALLAALFITFSGAVSW